MDAPCLFLFRAFFASLVLLASVDVPARAQLTADRPGFGDGASTVTPRTVQMELGYAYTGNGETTHELGQLLLRYGLTNALELRGGIGSLFLTNPRRSASLATTAGSVWEGGYSGTSAGVKLRLYDTRATTLSSVATVELPTEAGTNRTPDDRARQEVKLAFDASLIRSLTVSVNVGTAFFYASGFRDDRASEWLFIPTLSMPLSDSIGTYLGYAGFYSDSPDTHWLEAGLAVLEDSDTQFDVNAGLRLDGQSDAFFLGGGIAHRF